MIDFRNAYFIKLGSKGIWEKECIQGRYLKFGYNQ